MSSDILLLFIFTCDIIHGIIHELINYCFSESSYGTKKTLFFLALSFPLLVYVVIAMIYMYTQFCSEKCQCTENLRLLSELVQTIITFIGCLFYYIGDNLPKSGEYLPRVRATQQDNLQIATVVFLVFAALFYRILPYYISRFQKNCKENGKWCECSNSNGNVHQLQRYCKKNCKKNIQWCTKCFSSMDINSASRESHSFVVNATSILVITVDFDTWFTLIESKDSKMICPVRQRVGGWLISVLVIVVVFSILFAIFILKYCCESQTSVHFTSPWKKKTYYCEIINNLLIE